MRLKWSTLTVDEELSEPSPPSRAALRQARRDAVAAAATADAAPATAGKRRVLHHLAAGAVAGATAKTVEAPLDRVKIIFQVSKSRFSFRAAARQMVAIARNEGVQGLWKGNGAMMMRVIPYASINYAAHETLSRWLTPEGETRRSPLRKFIAGALTGMTSTICTYPIDVARARMAVAPKGVANNIAAVFVEMWADPRKSGAFYAGLTPTLAGIIPYSGTTWATYETLKERMCRARGLPPNAELPPMATAVAGGVAGICGQTVSYPLDVVRRRMQTAVVAPGLRRAPTMLAVFADLLRTEGVAGMYKGLSVNYFKAPIAMGISFSLYARVKTALENADARRRKEEEAAAAAAAAGAADAAAGGRGRVVARAADGAAAAAAAAAARRPRGRH